MTAQRDPTRSLGLRRRGRGLVNRRVFELHRSLRQTLQDQDMVGLRQRETMPKEFFGYIETSANRLDRSEAMLRRIVEEVIEHPPGWLYHLIERAVQRGVAQVGRELRVAVEGLDPREVTDLHGKAADIEVEGISGETQRRVLRQVSRALQAQWTPEVLMREVRRDLEKVTKLRLVLLVNTAIVRALNAGKLFAYGANGVEKVGIEPEWLPSNRIHDHAIHDRASRKKKVRERKKANKAKRAASRVERLREKQRRARASAVSPILVNVLTAGDDRVCEDCSDIAAEGPYDLEAAQDLIPAHPNCRCAFVPFSDERFAPIEEQEEILEELE